MRVLGIDFGERRVGVAVSDPTGTLASPLPTLKRRAGKRPPLAALEALVAEYGIVALVMGLPLDPHGSESGWTRQVREVGDALARRTGLPIHYVDERFTSVQAERAVRGIGLPKSKREEKGRIDAAAAVLILQSWLNNPEIGNPETELPDPSAIPGTDAPGADAGSTVKPKGGGE